MNSAPAHVITISPYQATESGITVTVLPSYLPHQSDPAEDRYVWGYTIRIRNDNDYSVQLSERHWIIYDAMGRKDEVRGEGVVGQTPVIKPATHFEYASFIPLTTSSGLMQGRYRLIRADGSIMWVKIPAFSLDSPGSNPVAH